MLSKEGTVGQPSLTPFLGRHRQGYVPVETGRENTITLPVEAKIDTRPTPPDCLDLDHLFQSEMTQALLEKDEKTKESLLERVRQMKALDWAAPETRVRLEELERKFLTYWDLRCGMDRETFEDRLLGESYTEVGHPLDKIKMELYLKWLKAQEKDP